MNANATTYAQSRRTPEPPAKLHRRLKGDLDNIVLKALRKEPARRYASVEQLTEDIRRHLVGLPVSATPDSLAYRASKFSRRHKGSIAAIMLIVVAVVGGVVTTVREAHIARFNEKRAEKRFNEVRKLADSLMFEIHDSIQDLPGATPARKLLINRALQYLDSLAQESQGDPSLRRELAAAYARVGDLQAYRGGPEDTAGGLASYQKALAIRDALHASDAGNLDDAVALADSSRQMSEAFLERGQPAAALSYSNRAVEISEQLAKAQPNNTRVLEELAHDYANQGNVLGGDFNWSHLGDNKAALGVRRKQLETATRVASLASDLPAAKRRMGDAMIMLGDQLVLDGERRAGRLEYLQALQVMESLLGHVQSAQLLNDSDALYQRLANIALQSGNFREAEAASRKALQFSEQLAHADPQNVWAKVMLAEDSARLANVLSRLGRRKESALFMERALSTIDGVALLNPHDTDILGTQANIDLTAAGILRESAQQIEALGYYRNALSIYSRVQAKQTSNVGIRLFIAAAYNGLGRIQVQRGDLKAADQAYRKALDLTDPQTSPVHRSADASYMMASAYAGLGELEVMRALRASNTTSQKTEHWKHAQEWYEASAKIWALVKEPGTASPNGLECVPPKVVNEQLARCNAVLQAVNAKHDKPSPAHAATAK